jgi:AcrR family transcriptional regulator
MKTKLRKARLSRSYHHGDLHKQLVAAAEQILSEKGVEGFTLREAARRAGVSPAAPAHHFKDATGLLTEVATLGFAELAQMLGDADRDAGPNPRKRLAAQGRAYVAFALKYPARFQLMFRSSRLDPTRGNFALVADRAFMLLADAVRDLTQTSRGAALSPDANGKVLALWSVVHGFAHLVLDGQMNRAAATLGGKKAIVARILPLTLAQLPWAVPPPEGDSTDSSAR